MVGQAVRGMLQARGVRVTGCDVRAAQKSERYDLRDAARMRKNLFECDGVIHFGAVSRVVWGERYPALCRSINIDGTRGILSAAAQSPRKPWLILSSSREIYGTPRSLPCSPGTPPNPENQYAKSKLAAETMALDLQRRGNRVTVLRFSNVFGTTADYHDRVAPAFAKAAANNGTLTVMGAEHFFDFTVLEDVVTAVSNAVDALTAGIGDLPPVDIVSGTATSLRDLAMMALANGGGRLIIAPPQGFYPKHFQGDPRPAEKYLNWRPRWVLEDAITRLVKDFRHFEK